MLVLLFGLVALSSCTGSPPPVPGPSTVTPSASSSASVIPTPTDPAQTWADTHVDWAIDEALAALAADPRNDLSHVVHHPVTEQASLTATQRGIYDDMVAKMRAVKLYCFSKSDDTVDHVNEVVAAWDAIYSDLPELAIYSGISAQGTCQLGLNYTVLSSGAIANAADLGHARSEATSFLDVARRIVQRIPQGASTYDKYRYLAYVESLITAYAFFSLDASGAVKNGYDWVDSAYAALVTGQAVCGGYAEAYFILCHMAGLWCQQVIGSVTGSTQEHAWNLVRLDSGTYFVDVTWSSNNGSGGSKSRIGSDAWMQYFMMDEATASVDHSADVKATGSASALMPR